MEIRLEPIPSKSVAMSMVTSNESQDLAVIESTYEVRPHTLCEESAMMVSTESCTSAQKQNLQYMEDEDSAGLTNIELHRLVLLEQLAVLKQKEERYKSKDKTYKNKEAKEKLEIEVLKLKKEKLLKEKEKRESRIGEHAPFCMQI